jgi:hypothetical protein
VQPTNVYDLPCIHRGEPTGETVQCGCSLNMQPAYRCNCENVEKEFCLMRIGARAKPNIKATHHECSSCDWRQHDTPASEGRVKQKIMATTEVKRAPLMPRPGDAFRAQQLADMQEVQLAKAQKQKLEDDYQEQLRKEAEERDPLPPFSGEIIRNLAYHIAPFSGNGTWQRNVAELRKRINQFNGKRIVAITTGPGMDALDDVKREFAGDVEEFIEVPNSTVLREVVTFVPLLERLESLDPNEVTFYGHAKGVTRPADDTTTCHRWTDLMRETCLDYWPLVEQLLTTHPIVGSFKKIGRCFKNSDSRWHYTGTFYWLRHAGVFNRVWRLVDAKWWGSESWPGLHFMPSEAGCLFRTGSRELDLYDYSYFHNSIMPDYADWQARHRKDRRSWA